MSDWSSRPGSDIDPGIGRPRPFSRVLRISVAAVAAMACVAPSPAGATWSRPQSLATPTAPDAVEAATGADGTVAVAWTSRGGGDRAWVATRAPGQSFATVQMGAPDDVTGTQPAVAVGAQGQVLTVWNRYYGTEAGLAAAFKTPAGSFETARLIGPVYSEVKPTVAFDGSGRAVVAWADREGISTITRSVLGQWSAPTRLRIPGFSVRRLGAAVAPNGDVVVGWIRYETGTGGYTASTAVMSARTGAVGAVEHLATDVDRYEEVPLLTAAPDGRFTALVRTVGGLRAFERPAGGSFIAAPLPPGPELRYSTIAWGPGGRSTLGCVCRRDEADEDSAGLQTADRPAGGAYAAPESGPRSSGRSLRLAYDSAGRLHAAYEGFDPHTERKAVMATTRGADGRWSAPFPVSDSELDVARWSFAVAGDGTSVIAWIRRRWADALIEAATWTPGPDRRPPAPPPAPPDAAALDSSSTYQADAARTGRLRGTGLTPLLENAWTFAPGWQNDYVVTDAGRVFALRRRTTDAPISLVALDIATGVPVWEHEFSKDDDPWGAKLAVGSGRVVVATSRSVVAVDAATGARLWRRPIGQYGPSPPMIAGDLVVVESGGVGNTVYAFTLADGAPRWQGPAAGTATIAGGQVATTGTTGHAVMRDLVTGRPLWGRFEGILGGRGEVGTYDGRYLWVAGDDLRSRVVDMVARRLVRRFDGYATAFAAPFVYVAQDSRVVALDPRTLEERWVRDLEASELVTAPLVADDLVFVGSHRGSIFALDRMTGAVRWSGPAGVLLQRWSSELPRGLAAGDGHLVVQSGSLLRAWRRKPARAAVTNGTLRYDGAPGSASRVAAFATGGRIRLRETGTPQIVPGAGCVAVALNEVSCERPERLRMVLGDGDDRASLAASLGVPASIDGGPGADVLSGGAARDLLFGQDGDDVLDGGGAADDLDGGAGDDRITYATRPADEPVAVLLDGVRNDGADPDRSGRSAAGEEADLDRGVERGAGGAGADVLSALVADAVVNVLQGGDGDDHLLSNDGTTAVDRLACGEGADRNRIDPTDRSTGCETAG